MINASIKITQNQNTKHKEIAEIVTKQKQMIIDT